MAYCSSPKDLAAALHAKAPHVLKESCRLAKDRTADLTTSLPLSCTLDACLTLTLQSHTNVHYYMAMLPGCPG